MKGKKYLVTWSDSEIFVQSCSGDAVLCPDVMCEAVWCGAHTVYNYMSIISAAVSTYSTRVGRTRARVTRAAANHSQRSIFTAKTQFTGQIKSHFGRCEPFPETHARVRPSVRPSVAMTAGKPAAVRETCTKQIILYI